jgi:hypothetical protein
VEERACKRQRRGVVAGAAQGTSSAPLPLLASQTQIAAASLPPASQTQAAAAGGSGQHAGVPVAGQAGPHPSAPRLRTRRVASQAGGPSSQTAGDVEIDMVPATQVEEAGPSQVPATQVRISSDTVAVVIQ